ncbi:hypothetical protein K438DRAFT_1773494 [Mycena galopus ATCC 62051]|nr:hypothetical protein K438DRAFT_1773494 [Mycena galopus ATCC 62051]
MSPCCAYDQSMQSAIRNEAGHKVATYWVATCEERGGEDLDSDNPNPFVAEGLSSDDASSDPGLVSQQGGNRDRLTEGKRLRETLKEKLFRAKERRRQRRAARRRQELM